MTTGKLLETLRFIVTLDRELNLQRHLQTLHDALSSLASAPANTSFQGTLADSKRTFETATATLASSISPSQGAVIRELGGEEFFTPEMATRIQEWITANPMTPTVARDKVQDLTSRRERFLNNVTVTLQGIEQLRVTETRVEASNDLAFLIPWELFDSDVDKFAKELHFINRLLKHIEEGVSGQATSVKLESLGSSDPTVTVAAGAIGVAIALLTVINQFLDAWKKVEEIREMRGKLRAMGLDENLGELTKKIKTTVEDVVEESTEYVLTEYKGEKIRRHELVNGLRADLKRLFGQLERGLKVEVHADPNKGKGDEEKTKLTTVKQLGEQLRFPEPSKEPLLLTAAEILEEGESSESHHTEVKTKKSRKITTTTTEETAPAKKKEDEKKE